MKFLAKNISKILLILTLLFSVQAPLANTYEINAQAKTTHVWIAPKHGKRYHYFKNCRGLNHATYKKHVTLHWAKHHGYSKCHFEK